MHPTGTLTTLILGSAGAYGLTKLYDSIDDKHLAAGATVAIGLPMAIAIGRLLRRYLIDDSDRRGGGNPPNPRNPVNPPSRGYFKENIDEGVDERGYPYKRVRRRGR